MNSAQPATRAFAAIKSDSANPASMMFLQMSPSPD
jgi:hypothetical protein